MASLAASAEGETSRHVGIQGEDQFFFLFISLFFSLQILFLDVLFPLDVQKIIFVDADQVVRADLMELMELDLGGAPYGQAAIYFLISKIPLSLTLRRWLLSKMLVRISTLLIRSFARNHENLWETSDKRFSFLSATFRSVRVERKWMGSVSGSKGIGPITSLAEDITLGKQIFSLDMQYLNEITF